MAFPERVLTAASRFSEAFAGYLETYFERKDSAREFLKAAEKAASEGKEDTARKLYERAISELGNAGYAVMKAENELARLRKEGKDTAALESSFHILMNRVFQVRDFMRKYDNWEIPLPHILIVARQAFELFEPQEKESLSGIAA